MGPNISLCTSTSITRSAPIIVIFSPASLPSIHSYAALLFPSLCSRLYQFFITSFADNNTSTTQHGQFVNNENRVDGNIGRNRRTQRTNVLECEGRYRGETTAQTYWYLATRSQTGTTLLKFFGSNSAPISGSIIF